MVWLYVRLFFLWSYIIWGGNESIGCFIFKKLQKCVFLYQYIHSFFHDVSERERFSLTASWNAPVNTWKEWLTQKVRKNLKILKIWSPWKFLAVQFLQYSNLPRGKTFAVILVVHSTMTVFPWIYDRVYWQYKYTSMLPQRLFTNDHFSL